MSESRFMFPFPGKIVVGVTGGIACGKSTVCDKLGRLAWEVISTDSYSHHFLDHDEVVKNAIFDHFHDAIKDGHGNIDKVELARVIFSSSVERKWLENLLHPKVRVKWMSSINHSSDTKFVVEVPLLFENNLDAFFTKTISVHASRSVQVQRLQERGLSDTEIDSRMNSQISVIEKSNRANFVILGDGDPKFLDSQINTFLSQL
ncbi:MAG: dephospho-CoA kinase [Opitutae bacterium]|nr:dephospho-CoA kinase [Opitutae bacterium]MBT5716769.1 dephospho-CoA kinase [Opitutae bacterium]